MIRFCWLVAIIQFAFVHQAILADEPAATQSLDDELLKELDNELTRDLENLPALKPKQPQPSGDTKESDPPPAEIDGEDIGQPSEDANPFDRIARRMRQVESRIARDQIGKETQQKQKQIVDDLAALIEQLNKECQGGECKPADKSQQSPPPSQPSQPKNSKKSIEPSAKIAKNPATDSGDKLRGDVTAKLSPDTIRQRMKDAWGNLPERLREQMLQNSIDEFLPKYELMIEQYFKRLAEDQQPIYTPAPNQLPQQQPSSNMQ